MVEVSIQAKCTESWKHKSAYNVYLPISLQSFFIKPSKPRPHNFTHGVTTFILISSPSKLRHIKEFMLIHFSLAIQLMFHITKINIPIWKCLLFTIKNDIIHHWSTIYASYFLEKKVTLSMKLFFSISHSLIILFT